MAFKKGISGNPAGRPKNKPSKASQMRKSLEGDMPEITNKLVELAKGGDIQAAKIILDRVCPALKSVAIPVEMPNTEGLSLADAAKEIYFATAAGEISPDIGVMLTNQLTAQAKLIETTELIKRIEALEDGFKK